MITVPSGTTENGIDHSAMFPIPLAERLIKTFSPPDGTVLDVFAGSGTTLLAAQGLERPFYGFDIMPEYVEIARQRLAEKCNQTTPIAVEKKRTEYVVLFKTSTGRDRKLVKSFRDVWTDMPEPQAG